MSQRDVASFTVTDLTKTFELEIKNALVHEQLSTENESPPRNYMTQKFGHLHDVKFDELTDPLIGVILDAKFAHTWMVPLASRTGLPTEPLAILTKFGWALAGPPFEKFQDEIIPKSSLCILDSEPASIQREIEKMFRHDFIGRLGERFSPEECHKSQYDEFSLAQLEETMVFNESSGHYRVGVPWYLGRERTAEIFENVDYYSSAKSRLDKLKVKMQRNPALKEGAFKQMNETLEQGHA